MKPILEVKGLWKEYRRGAQQERYLSLRDSLFKAVKPKKQKEKFWALQDLNFEVNPGDSLAIIGKNGAGKSTLLKILSRITPPTKGEIVLRGRLASLLEVGTGFHPELTGRENIFLNGSILGLGRQEINRQFDAIVDFSGVEAFLDTPLKHFSSGMQLRLAFAVAAHLEPEILVIDEVLAVGDSAFQQKCIQKMTEVSSSGRTLLFVSHNLAAIVKLCKKGLLLESGKLTKEDEIERITSHYTTGHITLSQQPVVSLLNKPRRSGLRQLEFESIKCAKWTISTGENVSFCLQLRSHANCALKNLLFGLAIKNAYDLNVVHLSNIFVDSKVDVHCENHEYVFKVQNLGLRSGVYSLTLFLKANEEVQDWIDDAAILTVAEGNLYGFPHNQMIKGVYQPNFDFYQKRN